MYQWMKKGQMFQQLVVLWKTTKKIFCHFYIEGFDVLQICFSFLSLYFLQSCVCWDPDFYILMSMVRSTPTLSSTTSGFRNLSMPTPISSDNESCRMCIKGLSVQFRILSKLLYLLVTLIFFTRFTTWSFSFDQYLIGISTCLKFWDVVVSS